MNESCSACRWWVLEPAIIRSDRVRVGECRRRSPRAIVGKDGRQHTNFPQSREDTFCGDHSELGK